MNTLGFVLSLCMNLGQFPLDIYRFTLRESKVIQIKQTKKSTQMPNIIYLKARHIFGYRIWLQFAPLTLLARVMRHGLYGYYQGNGLKCSERNTLSLSLFFLTTRLHFPLLPLPWIILFCTSYNFNMDSDSSYITVL